MSQKPGSIPLVDPDDLILPDDRSESLSDVEEPTVSFGKYNNLVKLYRETLQQVQELGEALQAARTTSSHTSPRPKEQIQAGTLVVSTPDSKVEPPPEFSGKISEFPNFMAACSLVFSLCPKTYSSDERKVLYVISRLRGAAMNWARSIAEDPEHVYRRDYAAFRNAFSNLYSDRNLRARNEDKLAHLEQMKSAAAYAAEFQSLIYPLNLDDSAKCLLFHKGLKPEVKDAIATVGRATTFTTLLDQAISIDQRKHQRALEEKKNPKNTSSRSPMSKPGKPGSSNPAARPPPSLDSQPCGQKRSAPKGPISNQEKSRRITEGLCLYCGESGHNRHDCPKKSKPESAAAMVRYKAPPAALEPVPPVHSRKSIPSPENYQSQAPPRSAT